MSQGEGDVGAATYRFPPLERRSVLLGLPAGPLLSLVSGLVAGVVLLGTLPGLLGPVGALAAVAAASVVGFWPLGGDPPVRWAPVVAGWVARRHSMPRLDRAPLAGSGPTAGGRRRVPPSPTAPAGITVRTAAAIPGEPEVGVIFDRRRGRCTAVVPIEGPSLGLLDAGEAAQQVARWGQFLAGVARDGTAIRRLQWVQRCSPADPEPLLAAAAAAPGPVEASRSYRRFVDVELDALSEHRTLLAVSVADSRALAGLRPPDGVEEVLGREVRLVRGQLRAAGLRATAPLGRDQLGVELAAGAAPTLPPGRQGHASPWPSAVDEQWGSVRVDGTWQVTYWVAEWPRVPVGPDVLVPLLAAGGIRSTALTMAPVAPDRAVREVQAARTSGMADDTLRQRAGFVTTARRAREAEAVRRREFELADGHGDYRFSGYVTVADPTAAGLEARCGEVEQLARRSGLVLRRLYGRQAEARTWTLPLGLGLS